MKIKLFAVLKDRLGDNHIIIDLPENLNAEDLKSHIKDTYPQVEDIIDLIRVAVNEEFIDDSDLINENDIVALIPPSSGG